MKKEVKNYENRTSYDGVEPNENEIIVPWVLSIEMKTLLREQGFESYQVETHRMPNGKTIKVFFMRIPIEKYEDHVKAYNDEINLFLTNERDAKSHYERKITEETEQSILSLDKIFEDIENDDAKTIDPTGNNIYEDYAKFESLLNYYLEQEKDEKNRMIIQMLWQEYDKKEIWKKVLPQKRKSQAYDYIKKIQEATREILKDMLK